MKSCFFFILGLSLALNGLRAQSTEDSSVFNNGIRMLEKARTVRDFLSCAQYFEQLDMPYSSHWLTAYYTGLSYIQGSYHARKDAVKDSLLDIAQPWVDKAFKARSGESEVHVLQAFLYQSRLQVNPQLRGLSLSQKADASLKKAVTADPSNPRAYMLLGYNTYYTPAVFGGGAKKALPLFLKAKDKFQTFQLKMPYYPNWGKPETLQMIMTCNQANN